MVSRGILVLTRKDTPPTGPVTPEYRALGWVDGETVLRCFEWLRPPPERPHLERRERKKRKP